MKAKNRIFDNGSETVDRGTWKGGNTNHLGKEIKISELSFDAQMFVIDRLPEPCKALK